MHHESVENCHSIRINLVLQSFELTKRESSTSHYRYRIGRWNIFFLLFLFFFFQKPLYLRQTLIPDSLQHRKFIYQVEKNPFSSSNFENPPISIDTRLDYSNLRFILVPSRDNFNVDEEQKRETVRKNVNRGRFHASLIHVENIQNTNNSIVSFYFSEELNSREKNSMAFCEKIKFFDILFTTF